MALGDIFRKLSKSDMKFIREYLDDEAILAFMCMNNMNKHHCIRVAKAVIENKDVFDIGDRIKDVVIAALLHDVGKSKCRQSIIYKVLFVLLKKQHKKGNLKWREAEKYYNHAKISKKILEDKNVNNMVLNLVENHHKDTGENDDKYLNALKYCDDKN